MILAQAVCYSSDLNLFNQGLADAVYISHWATIFGSRAYPLLMISMLLKTYVFS